MLVNTNVSAAYQDRKGKFRKLMQEAIDEVREKNLILFRSCRNPGQAQGVVDHFKRLTSEQLSDFAGKLGQMTETDAETIIVLLHDLLPAYFGAAAALRDITESA